MMMNQILATLIFFTRLPFWRIRQVPAECFKHVVPYWPLAGYVTGGITALTFWVCSYVFPPAMAWTAAIAARLLATGCLHEDGLADFFDGMGGGITRDRVLAIMKDSHIGTYGVVGLIGYFLCLSQMAVLPQHLLLSVAFAGDCWSKHCASHIVNTLPYARKEEESKAKTVYAGMNAKELGIGVVSGILPALLLLPGNYWIALLTPVIIFFALTALMRRRIQGYTGDCCGALFLCCELSFLMACLAIYHTAL